MNEDAAAVGFGLIQGREKRGGGSVVWRSSKRQGRKRKVAVHWSKCSSRPSHTLPFADPVDS